MRTLLFSTAALAVGFILSAAAQNAATQQNAPPQQNALPQQNAALPSSGCGPNAMSAKTSQGIAQSGFTDAQEVPKAVVVHALDPDGNPVFMILAPAN